MNTIDYNKSGTVFDIQRYSLHDGPGIRTIVFLKGCPLRCLWCSNPESQNLKPSIMFDKKSCINCGKCLNVCKYKAISDDKPFFVNVKKCVGCGECTKICPTNALTLSGKEMNVGEVITELKKDATVYRRSGGGITLSGGEPLMQSDFVSELLKACKAQGWHTAMETTGFGRTEKFEEVFPYTDLVLLDIKAMDSVVHKNQTGVSNELILTNAMKISQMSKVAVRVPTIPAVNDSVESFEQLCRFVKTLYNVEIIHILPYHRFGQNKYELLGMAYEMKKDIILEPHQIEVLKSIVEKHGFTCIIGG